MTLEDERREETVKATILSWHPLRSSGGEQNKINADEFVYHGVEERVCVWEEGESVREEVGCLLQVAGESGNAR